MDYLSCILKAKAFEMKHEIIVLQFLIKYYCIEELWNDSVRLGALGHVRCVGSSSGMWANGEVHTYIFNPSKFKNLFKAQYVNFILQSGKFVQFVG